MILDYTTLQANVAEWAADYIAFTREEHGEEAARDTTRLFAADPWLALQWFVEDQRGPGHLRVEFLPAPATGGLADIPQAELVGMIGRNDFSQTGQVLEIITN